MLHGISSNRFTIKDHLYASPSTGGVPGNERRVRHAAAGRRSSSVPKAIRETPTKKAKKLQTTPTTRQSPPGMTRPSTACLATGLAKPVVLSSTSPSRRLRDDVTSKLIPFRCLQVRSRRPPGVASIRNRHDPCPDRSKTN